MLKRDSQGPQLEPVDLTALGGYNPTDGANSHPSWLRERFPEYIAPHAGHEAQSVRQFTHHGREVRIITTYRIEVDGKPVRAHLSVDEDGLVFTHATPFVTYASANELMRAVIDAYPESFERHEGGHGGHT